MTGFQTAGLPDAVAVRVRANGHDMTPMVGAFDETHQCTRCSARAYPMVGHRKEWMGWATEYACAEVQALNAPAGDAR